MGDILNHRFFTQCEDNIKNCIPVDMELCMIFESRLLATLAFGPFPNDETIF